MRITPGYDFTFNEVPTRVKLFQMAAGMSVAGIDITQIDAVLTGTKLGHPTAVSLPGEGWMNYDTSSGRLWVRTRFGNVPVYRASLGGWETYRYRLFVPEDSWTPPIDNYRPFGSLYAVQPATGESATGYHPAAANVGPMFLKNTDSGASGDRMRLLGRGGYFAETLAAERTTFPEYVRTSPVGVFTTSVTPFPADTTGNGLGRKMGIGLLQNPLARTYCWYFGMAMMQD